MISQKNSRKIKVLSFALFWGVMAIHTYNLEVYNMESSSGAIVLFETYMNRLMNGVCVPYFFVISGFLFFRNFDITLLISKYKSRFHSILVPYVMWNTLYYCFFVIITRIPFLADFVNGGVIEFSIKAYVNYIWDGYYVFWFLRVLIWMVICAPLLWLLLKRRKYYWPEVILAVLVVLDLVGKSVFAINAYYALGAYLGMNCRSLLANTNRKMAALAAVCFLGILTVGGFFAGNIIYNCTFMLASWFALDLFAFSKNVKWWIECTFFYYCAHDMILESAEKVILILFGKNEIMALMDYLMAPVLTLIILIGVAWGLRKYANATWKILSGGR